MDYRGGDYRDYRDSGPYKQSQPVTPHVPG